MRPAIDAASPHLNSGVKLEHPLLSTRCLCCSLSVVKSYCGHGIGDLFHCEPNVPHYSPNKAVGVMKEGHTFTIEVSPALPRGAACCLVAL